MDLMHCPVPPLLPYPDLADPATGNPVRMESLIRWRPTPRSLRTLALVRDRQYFFVYRERRTLDYVGCTSDMSDHLQVCSRVMLASPECKAEFL